MDVFQIELKKIIKKFDENLVLDNISLQIKTNETVAIVGESGCGKTTLLRILAGLDTEYTGEILLNGKLANKAEPYQRDMALVFQDSTLWGHMSVQENILFSAKRSERQQRQSTMNDVCRALGIEQLLHRYPDEISGGQAKRVSLARAIVSEKKILLLDEPLSNIDQETRENVINFLKKKYLGKRTIIYVSHDMEEVKCLCDRVVTL